ncbi:MAG: tRNA 2-thiocytidine(32) synthetase TtcA [Candidatus Cloacimonadota bacterium]|nr:MAG: tRNA 2-thiocytidine(32) synthetase TtcA [Candidatus Cloacimonadota bacterium]
MKKFQKKILRKTGKAINLYNLISEGDKIIVGLSGGKDSWTLLKILLILQAKAPVNFYLKAVKIAYPHTEEQNNKIKEYCLKSGIEFYVLDRGVSRVMQEKSEPELSHCALCSRLRRGILYSEAVKTGFNKIALGHHREDFNTTLLLNLFFQSSIKPMKPIMKADDYPAKVIRPLALTPENLIAEYASREDFPVLTAGCSYSEKTERERISRLLDSLEKTYPQIKQNIISAQQKLF